MRRGDRLVPPEIAPRLHDGRGFGRALEDQNLPHVRAALQRLVDDALQLNGRATTVADVLGNDDAAVRVVHPIGNRLRREAAEDHRMYRPHARTGQPRDGQLRGHPHVDRDAVTLPDPSVFERIGEPLHLHVQLRVGKPANLTRLTLPEQCYLVPPAT